MEQAGAGARCQRQRPPGGGEAASLEALGIESIALQREGVPHLDQGNLVYGTSEVRLADNRTPAAVHPQVGRRPSVHTDQPRM